MTRLAILLIPALAFSQQAAPPIPDGGDTIRVDVDNVSVLCSVRDKKGALIGNLNKSDFTIFEDGKQQDLKYFTRETDLPLTIGVLVDVSKSQERLIEAEKQAASQFFTKVLQKKDMAFLISFGAEAELLQDLTNSPKLLRQGLEGLRLNVQLGGLHPGPVPTASKPKGTIMYDSVYLAANEKLKRETGRKVIILITDGEDYGSSYTRNQAIEMAQKSDAIIYSIYYADFALYRSQGRFTGNDGDLRKMSEDTGGRVLHVDRKNSLDDVFNQIQQEMRTQYALGYAPANPKRDGGFRKIEIKTANKDLKVQARRGYYAVAN